MKRVKQISIDILVDGDKDGCVFAEQIARDLEAEGNVVLGASFQDDLTELYKRNYPELLEESEEEKNENWGEETCPYCDHVNDFVWEEGTKRTIICKNCGKEILLCSLCDMDKVSCGKCPYDNREKQTMSNLTHLFKVGQKVTYRNNDFDAVKRNIPCVVKETYPDHIIITDTETNTDLWIEEGFNMDCVYPEYNMIGG